MENGKEKENEIKNDEKIEEILNDRYKDYHTSPFEPMKNANPRILIGVGIIAIILAVVIIVVFGGAKKADAKVTMDSYVSGKDLDVRYSLADEEDPDDPDDTYDPEDPDDPYEDDPYDDDEYYDITKYPYRNITLYNGMNITEKTYGNPGDYDEDDFSPSYFYYGDQGRFSFTSYDEDDWYDEEIVPYNRSKTLGYDEFEGEKIQYSVDNTSVVRINESDHTYKIVGGGKATVTATYGQMKATFVFLASNDTSSAVLEKKDVTLYMMDEYESGTANVRFNSSVDFTYSSVCLGKVSGNLECNSIWLDPKEKTVKIKIYESGEGDVTFYLNGVPFTVHIGCKVVNINVKTRVLDKGKSFTIKLKNYPGTPEWKSSDTKIASVSGSGTVKGKRIGNAIIYTDMDGSRIGCIVSVVKKGVTKACARATFIGTHWKYSQEKRMKKGYYDCSALVWKSYKAGGIYVAGAKGYAPTAAELGKWCVGHKRKVGKFSWNKILKLKYLPGDCLFLTGAKNGRYKGISHVEMITGYYLYGFSNGKPQVDLTWGARGVGYGGSSSDIVGRPVN